MSKPTQTYYVAGPDRRHLLAGTTACLDPLLSIPLHSSGQPRSHGGGGRHLVVAQASAHSVLRTRVPACRSSHSQAFAAIPASLWQLDSWSTEEALDRIADYDICIPGTARIDAAVIARATRLQLIVQFGVGLEGVDLEAATRARIKVARISSAHSGSAIACAEYCIYMMFGLLRHQKDLASSFAAKKLCHPPGSTLYGKTVFILGYGNIGKELAHRLRPFGVNILAVRRSWTNSVPSDSDFYQEGTPNVALSKSSEEDDLEHEKGGIEHTLEFASRADIIVMCCTLNPSTKGIVDGTFLSAMKKGAYIVNVARGGLLDYDAVLAALQSGHLGGLAADVAWSEPFDPSDPILQFPNVLITPHISGVTALTYESKGQIIANAAHQLSIGMPTTAIEYVN